MNISLIGLQWGDEGKGKIIDFLSIYFDITLRYNGGHNAGHIIYYNNIKKILKLTPSGFFKKNSFCYISNNVILSLKNIILELNELILFTNFNLYLKKIAISNKCLLNIIINELIDYLIDKILKIGTTLSGIGPTFVLKYLKCSLFINSIYYIYFIKKIKKNIFCYNLFFFFFKLKIKILYKNIIFINIILLKKFFFFFINNDKIINNNNKKIFESSQGCLLDLNCGTYPFVTSSNTINKSIYILSNYYLYNLKFIGIFKAYLTRVGNGFFLSKFNFYKNLIFALFNNEIGTNSNRIRNSGWLDLFLIIKMIKINNISNLIITKMDILSFFKKIKIIINYFLIKNSNFINKVNIYNYKIKIFNSWNNNYHKYYKNEKNFHKYIRFIEKYTNTPIFIISIGKNIFDLIII
ncbi:adenylosuccinate synthetase [Candidatus Carsonella ruddii]|uniref:Adenylosuccinate synthetase n=1 Tax=Candidatus Carsonella ruddii CE isolate Thao2000 TaxID=1202536 RepID=J7GY67_CARRU|nr:adenylosuccinate synthetase [Candidatus Carsonella ruddii]AFP83508.1 adenylosuccinate synthase [Candidatus Carsonella ruddii CE isolate Thao2000]